MERNGRWGGGSYQEDSTCGRIRFLEGHFWCPGIHNVDVGANLCFEKATGILVNIFSGFWPGGEADMMSPELVRAACHAKCDAAEATPLSES
jgi:hypothetical protein